MNLDHLFLMLPIWILMFSLIVLLSLFSCSFSFSLSSSNNTEQKNNKTSFFGCEKYAEAIHCDLFKNEFSGNEIPQKSTEILNITREPIYIDGKFGKAIEFNDKYREYIEIPKNKIYNSSQFSISFWVKKTNGTQQASSNAHIISFINRDKKSGWYFDTNSSADQAVRFIVSDKNGDPIISNSIPISNSSFTNIAATFDDHSIKVYRNGDLVNATNYNGNYTAPPNNIPIHIGSASYCDSCEQFNGLVDDIRIYNRTISDEDVKQLYANSAGENNTDNPALPINKGLVGHWTFDTTLKDSSLMNNPGKMFTFIVSMVTAPDGRTFISEKNTGKIVIMKDEKLLEKPFALVNDSYVNWEQGLLGLAIDPKFTENHFIYLYYTAINNDGNPINRIVRFTDKDNVGTNMTVIFDNIPASHGYHSGGGLAFGPDGKLYATVGDATEHRYAQSISVPLGKTLRINSDGSIPQDNPFSDSPVYTLGHRNMIGIAFDYKDKIGIITENGDILYDEVNLIEKGGNYGFPTLQIENISPELSNSTLDIKPLRSFWHTIAPTQAIYYTGDIHPTLKDKFLFGTFTGAIYAVHINNNTNTIDSEQHILTFHYPFDPVIGITQTPKGDIYYGAYHIYKLISVNENKSKQILFPIRFDYSKDMVIDKVQTETEKYLNIDLHFVGDNTSGAKNDGNHYTNITNSTSYQYVQAKFPTSLIKSIENVTSVITYSNDKTIQKLLPYHLDNDSLANKNAVTISLPLASNISKIQISINGSNNNNK